LLLGNAKSFTIQFLGGIGMTLPPQQLALVLFSSAANQRSPVLSTICKASSNRLAASSIFPAISDALARRAMK